MPKDNNFVPYPFKWTEVSEQEALKIKRSTATAWVRSEPGNVWMKKGFEQRAEEIYNLEVRPDDIWIITYPKCGTTLAQVT